MSLPHCSCTSSACRPCVIMSWCALALQEPQQWQSTLRPKQQEVEAVSVIVAACQTICNLSGGYQAGSRLAAAASSGEMQCAAFVDLEAGSGPDSKSRGSKWPDLIMTRQSQESKQGSA